MKLTRLSLLLAAIAILPQAGEAAPCRNIYNVTLPITQSGTYCLPWDLYSSTGAGIVVRADNVTIDFQGHKLSTPSNPASTAITTGVDASSAQNVTIKNGTLQGYIDGINVGERVAGTNLGNYVVTNMRIDNAVANNWRAIGIFAQGANFTLTNNTITNLTGVEAMGVLAHATASNIPTPGKVVVSGNRIDRVSAVNGNSAYGIILDGGTQTVVNENTVTEVYSGGANPNPFQTAYGVYVAQVTRGGLVELAGNVVRNNTARTNTTGIVLNNTDDLVAFVRDSVVTRMNTGLYLGGSCAPFYLYNTVTLAANEYTNVGTQVPCAPQNVGPGPGNQ